MDKKIEIHGHRGARGLYSENTLKGFIEAVKLGIDAIELDVVVSKDEQVVVSHEEWMNDLFCLTPHETAIKPNSKYDFNLYDMAYEEIMEYDCGSKQHPDFQNQKTEKAYKPLLSEVINEVENYIDQHQLKPVTYNIEIKSEDVHYDLFQPRPKKLVELVLNTLKPFDLQNRIMIQSFDITVLKTIYHLRKNISLGVLIENKDDYKTIINRLGFKPDFYNPEYILVNPKMIAFMAERGIKVIPWTVNNINDMQKLIAMGVDGLITDYPNLAIDLCKS